jgi:hypothetical protein
MSRTIRRVALVAAATTVLTVPLAIPAAATTPPPQPGYAPGASTTAIGFGDSLEAFWQRTDTRLAHKTLRAGAWGAAEDLGGSIATGPAPITIGSEFAGTWVFAAAPTGAVYYRLFSDGSGTWGPWTSIGGFTVGTPATSCTGDFSAQPVVWVVGGDGALWRRSLAGGGWTSLGGVLGSEPAAVPAVGGVCPPAEDVVALGGDFAVWERRAGGWSRIGGRSFYAPSIVRLPNGVSHLFVIGTNNALYTATRQSDAGAWSGFSLIGGLWTSPPAAQVYPLAPTTLTVLALGGNNQLYRASRTIGTPSWSIAQVP